MTQSTSDILIKVRSRLADKKHWWPGGDPCPDQDCLLQMINKVAGDPAAAQDAIKALAGTHAAVIALNDNHSHSEVLALLDAAIDRERAADPVVAKVTDIINDAVKPTSPRVLEPETGTVS